MSFALIAESTPLQTEGTVSLGPTYASWWSNTWHSATLFSATTRPIMVDDVQAAQRSRQRPQTLSWNLLSDSEEHKVHSPILVVRQMPEHNPHSGMSGPQALVESVSD